MTSQILLKSTELLSYILSFGKMNQLAEPIKEELENGRIIPIQNELEEYYSFCHSVEMYKRMENLTIELSILLRRLYETSYRDINNNVKYRTPGIIYNSGNTLNFKQVLNKIVHSISIQYEVQDGDNEPCFEYLYGKNVKFTGNLYVRTDGEPSQYLISMVEVCMNAFILSSIDH